MAGQTLTTLDAVLKNIYLPVIREQFADNQILLKELKRDSENITGKQAIIAVHYQGNEGIGSRGEYDDLPEAGGQKYEDVYVPMKLHFGRIQFTDASIEATKNDKGAFIRVVNSETKGIVDDMKRDVSRQLYGDGTGLLATCGTTTASNTVQLATDAKMIWLRKDMKVDILVKATGTSVATARTITAVNIAAKTITIDGAAVTTDSTHGVYRTGSYGKEMLGLAIAIADTGTYLGIDRSTNSWWNAVINSGGGTPRALSEDLIQQVLDEIDINGGQPSIVITSHAVRRKLFGLLVADRQFTNVTTFRGGFKALEYNGLPFIVDPNCPAGTMLFLDTGHFTIYQMSDISWLDEDGAVLHRITNKPAWEATLKWYAELGCDRCNVQGALKDIQE